MSEPVAPPSADGCPSCGATLPPNAVICVHCGLNLKTGKMLKSGVADSKPARRKPKAARDGKKSAKSKWVAALAAAVVAGAAIWPLRNALRTSREETAADKPVPAPSPIQPGQTEPAPGAPPKGDVTDTGSANYRKWLAENEPTTKETDFLVVKGPRAVVAGVVAGITATPLWKETSGVLGKVSPPVAMTVTCDYHEKQDGALPVGKKQYGALELRVLPAGAEGAKPFLASRIVCAPPAKVRPMAGLSTADATEILAKRRAAKHLARELPFVAAAIAAHLPAVSDRVLPLAKEWLASPDDALVCSACAYLSLLENGDRDGALLDTLCRMLGAADPEHRFLALRTLSARDRRADASALPHVLPLLGDEDQMIREQVVRYLGEYVLAEESVPYLCPAATSGGSAGRLWLVQRLLAVKPGEPAARVVGSVLLAAIEAEGDPAAKTRLQGVATRDAFVRRFEEYSASMTSEQIVLFLLLPHAGLSSAAQQALGARAKEGQDFASVLPQLKAAVGKSQGAWRLLGVLAARGARPEDRAARAAYRQGWGALAQDKSRSRGWLLCSDDVGTAAKLARRDAGFQKTVANAMLHQDDPLLSMALDLPAAVPASDPDGAGALQLALSWRKFDDEAKAAALSYMARGMGSRDERISVAVARVFLVAHAYQVFMDAEIGRHKDRVGLCRGLAERIVLEALDSPDPHLRRQAVWAAGKAVAPDVLRGHIDAIARILVETLVAMEPGRMEQEARRLAEPYRVGFSWRIDAKGATSAGEARIQEGVWPQTVPAIRKVLAETRIAPARRKQIARALGCDSPESTLGGGAVLPAGAMP